MTDLHGHGPQLHLLVAGASGVIGSAAVEHFAKLPGWRVTALSRRRPIVSQDAEFAHVGADLRDARDCARAIAAMPSVTHLIFAAVSEAPGLVSGWRDKQLIQENGRMFANLLGPLAATGSLRHVNLLQGTKAYGGHVHPVAVPLREGAPRDEHPNFYWLHEDFTREQSARHEFSFTIFRPQILLGTAPGAAMNPVAGIGAFAALCQHRGLPFALPGQSEALWEVVDAGLLAEAMAWAAISPAAVGETFNFTNGDIFVLRHAWQDLAAVLGLGTQGDPPETFAGFFAARENQTAWSEIAGRHGLAVTALDALLGQSHHYLDLLLGQRIAGRANPALLSTIKIRQAGFAGCSDSRKSLIRQIGRMVGLKLLPPMGHLG